jgi:ribonuclease Z
LVPSFKITILGNGAASPTLERPPSSQIIELSGRYFLVDCGESIQLQLRKYKFSIQKIDHILITHLHGDHYLGLLGLLQSMHLLGRKSEINLYCQPELKEIIDLQNRISQTFLNFSIRYVFLEPEDKYLIFEDEKLRIYSFPLKHRIACNGFLLEEKPLPFTINKKKLDQYNIDVSQIHKLKKGMDVENEDGQRVSYQEVTTAPRATKSYAICSDTIYDEGLKTFINGVDVLYHESTFLNDMKERAKKTFHSTASQAAHIALLIHAKHLILGHFSARYGHLQAFADEAAGIFNNVSVAKEGEVYQI